MLGILCVQSYKKQNIKSIINAMLRFCRDKKTFNHAKITKIVLEIVCKEPSIEYNYLPRGRLNEHQVRVIDEKSLRRKTNKIFKVVMLNDDYTPMDFVVYLLKTFFHMNTDKASKIMLEVHNKGAGICGVFTLEIAETKILKVIDTSRKNGFPLLCTLEKH